MDPQGRPGTDPDRTARPGRHHPVAMAMDTNIIRRRGKTIFPHRRREETAGELECGGIVLTMIMHC